MKYLITFIGGDTKVHFVNHIHLIDNEKSIYVSIHKNRSIVKYKKEEYTTSTIIDTNNEELFKLFNSDIPEISLLAKQKILKLANIEYEQIY